MPRRQSASFRLDPKGIEDLAWLSKRLNISQGRLIENLARQERERLEAEAGPAKLAELEERVAQLEARISATDG